MGQKRIFISHSWKSANVDDYRGVKNLLENRSYFNYQDYSVDSAAPLSGDVWTQIENKIKNSNIFIVTAGVYSSHSSSIQKEINLAEKYGKKIIAVKPRGNIRISEFARLKADHVVGYNTESIVNAIRS